MFSSDVAVGIGNLEKGYGIWFRKYAIGQYLGL